MSGPLIYKKGLFGGEVIPYALYFDSAKKQRIEIESFTPSNASGYTFQFQFYKGENFTTSYSDCFLSARQTTAANLLVINGFLSSTNNRLELNGRLNSGTSMLLVYNANNNNDISIVYAASIAASGTNTYKIYRDSTVMAQNFTQTTPDLSANNRSAYIGADVFDLNTRNYKGYIANPIFYTGIFGTEILKPDFANAYTSGSDIIVPDLCGNYTMKARNWTNLADYQSALKRLDTF